MLHDRPYGSYIGGVRCRYPKNGLHCSLLSNTMIYALDYTVQSRMPCICWVGIVPVQPDVAAAEAFAQKCDAAWAKTYMLCVTPIATRSYALSIESYRSEK